MIVLLDTSTPVCRVGIVKSSETIWHEWEAHRDLSRGLLQFLSETLALYDADFSHITAFGVFRGPGSFTGLRIGLTVINTLADGLQVPIVGAQGEDWGTRTLDRLKADENDQVVLPDYGADAHITKPRK